MAARAIPSHGLPARGPPNSGANFVLAALRETDDLVAAAVGEERRQQLRIEGATMNVDEAVAYALGNIDPKVFTGPIANINR